MRSSTGGFVAGTNATVFDMWRLGVMAGYSHSSFSLDSPASSGSSDNYTLRAYSGTEHAVDNGQMRALRTGLAYTWNKVDMGRTVSFPGLSDDITADSDAANFQVFGELSYEFNLGNALIEPYANLAHVHLRSKDFREHRRTAAPLSVNSGTMDSFLHSRHPDNNGVHLGNGTDHCPHGFWVAPCLRRYSADFDCEIYRLELEMPHS